MGEPVYLDHNATTPIAPEVVAAMLPFLSEHFGNPSSAHVYGARAKAAVERARAQVARLLDAEPDELVFTSGGTEANNLALFGCSPRHVVTSVIEHPATLRPCEALERRGAKLTRLGVDRQGRVKLEGGIPSDASLVSVMSSNNETGVLQPVRELAELGHAAGALVHTDAAQSVGKIPVSVRELGVDLLSVAGHKLYAPKGVGALYVKRGTPLSAFTLGAGHERGLRPGTENVASIVGLGAACELAARVMAESAARMQALTRRLHERLANEIPGLELNGHPELRLPNTLNLRFPGVSGTELLARTPEIAASTGSACHDGHEAASAVILAMGVDPSAAVGSVRLTLGRATSEDEIALAARALVRAFRDLASSTRSGP